MAEVEGDIEEIDGVLRITTIRLHYRVTIPAGTKQSVLRALDSYADKCPAYQSVKGCINCSWETDIQES